MKFKVERYGIDIVPETKEDEAYIEDTMGLREDGDAILLVRQNAHALGCMGNLSTHPFPKKDITLVGDSLELINIVRRSLPDMPKTDIPDLGKITYGHPAIDEVMQWFQFGQLPDHLKPVSRQVGALAHDMAMEFGEHGGPELTKGLAKLLEAKDCLVRAAVRAKHKRDEREAKKGDE